MKDKGKQKADATREGIIITRDHPLANLIFN